MSILNIGLTGLKSTQTALEVTSNNIANSATAGYKQSDAEFASVYNGGQQGGVKVTDIKEDFVTGGEIVRTGNSLDITIDGQGFFAISENGKTAYTQAGQFGLDSDLNIVNANGSNLQGYGISESENGGDPSIVSGILTDLKIEGANIPAKATDGIDFNGNLSSSSDLIPYPTAPDTFDPTDGSQYNFSQSTEVFDSLGNSHIMTQYFNHTATNEWQVMYFVDGEPLTTAEIATTGTNGTQDVVVDGTTIIAGVVTMTFDTDGQMAPLSTTLAAPIFTPPGTVADDNSVDPYNEREITLTFTASGGGAPIDLTLDMVKTTQFGTSFAMYENDASGYTSGSFSGVTVAEDGKLYATFTNGESKLQGQVALASFANVNGLQPGDNTVWYETDDSGTALFSEPDSGAIGKLLSGSYMGSNVDVSEQLVGLMSFQQNYQANAKTISTADEMMQILFSNT
ncbi:flagellar hook-basal body complex protein [Colwellia sp. 1_MG-2023]|uniref:flagellar hook protein FlgE n=1 Tax=unclassified Colwellia TaxID=196834 RepID=UPI001C08B8D6|nr:MULTISPECIES: flagellar hook-basal body complex protein [unclassified Colwellia]MBU2925586.1 flagellar hook-basal body complex protein [Colwellia sp. C2M11]MDO6654053.1 flagellar hook-basal body complex protein [Colwellia sp. 3_MG-2023]MDO6666980.1 flagellar hook-basal body complex protein [Colwellia sp. 2_MG-2023]MDO6691385.1 flagellar hook-basal body complex protein [Colwellia sp. 1_MG-2023]